MNRKNALRVVLVLIAINAAFGVFTLLGGSVGETQEKVLGTSLLATLGAILALANAPAASSGRAWFWPRLGMASAVVSSGAFIVAIWTEGGETLIKVGGTAIVLAVTAATISILSGWPTRGALFWINPATTALAALAAGMIVYAIWFGSDIDSYWRIFGIVVVLFTGGAIATPVVNKMSGGVDAGVAITHCPFDGTPVTGKVGKAVECGSCGRRFTVTVR